MGIQDKMLAAQVVKVLTALSLPLFLFRLNPSTGIISVPILLYDQAFDRKQFQKPYKIHEVPTPGKDLNEYDMLVKVAVASLCHTDGMVLEGIMGTPLPCTASHEGSGTVVKVGCAIKEFRVGDRVLCSLTYHGCGKCGDCTGPEVDTQYCPNVGGYLGVNRDGSFAEYEVEMDGNAVCCQTM
jgi:propanol-preferring alcohol dehydrogenase